MSDEKRNGAVHFFVPEALSAKLKVPENSEVIWVSPDGLIYFSKDGVREHTGARVALPLATSFDFTVEVLRALGERCAKLHADEGSSACAGGTTVKPARCLFIGGSHDGTWRQVDSDREIIAVPKLAKMKPLVEPKVSETTTAQVSIEEYRREIFREGDRDFVLFVHGSIKPLKIIERLMIGYCPVREGGGS